MEEDTYGTREDHVYALRILELVNRCHACAKEHGFWDEYSGPRNTTYLLARIALVMSELGECVEAVRDKHILNGNLNEELADVVIRVFDLAGGLNYDLGTAILEKIKVNEGRPHMHGKKA